MKRYVLVIVATLMGSGCGFMTESVIDLNNRGPAQVAPLPPESGHAIAAGAQMSTGSSMMIRARLGGTTQGQISYGSTVQARIGAVRLVK